MDVAWLVRPVALAVATLVLCLAATDEARGSGELDGVGIPAEHGYKLAKGRYVERLKDGGVSEVRFLLQPLTVNDCDHVTGDVDVPSSTSRLWSDWDKRLQVLANKGVEAVPLIIGWEKLCFGTASESDGEPRGIPTRNLDEVDDFYHALVRRYSTGGRGSYWRSNDGPDSLVERFEIHNEPNLEFFWNRRKKASLWREVDGAGNARGDCDRGEECVPSPADYADYLRRSARAIREIKPDVEVISAGLADDVSGLRWGSIGYPVVNGATGPDSYVDDMLQRLERRHGSPAAGWDEFGFHPYGSWRTDGESRVLETGAHSTGDLAGRLYDELRRNGVGAEDRRIALTEWGWGTYSTGGEASYLRGRIAGASSVAEADSSAEQSFVRAEQARLLGETHADLEAIAPGIGLTRAFVYELEDKSRFPKAGSWADYSGLFKRSGKPKPAWRTMVNAFDGRSDGGTERLP